MKKKTIIQFVSSRVINDVAPLMKKNNYKKFMNPKAFAIVCQLFYEKQINNIQFKKIIQVELEEINK